MNPLFSPFRLRLVWALVALSGVCLNSAAQEPNASQRPNPLDAQAEVPPVIYLSPFQAYRPYLEQEVSSWKEANDNTARVGGWRVYAKQAREADASEAKPPAKDASIPDKSKQMDKMEHKK
ncbi:hypothetical protein LPB67_14945 [Undibacterium sp. Jales W-56]|uniref:hypothetical protein n=1 Tax=Undibacterium sp. Jales W-56 TaxID=2897325 RepID=UPI0021D16D46|nr:hypothetical protein [Undibacterium sp. Jales W-56]MCU6435073.1 hypothetical protein [Undibacterium sp. Jales W-56]